jgi:hypothetical protein
MIVGNEKSFRRSAAGKMLDPELLGITSKIQTNAPNQLKYLPLVHYQHYSALQSNLMVCIISQTLLPYSYLLRGLNLLRN